VPPKEGKDGFGDRESVNQDSGSEKSSVWYRAGSSWIRMVVPGSAAPRLLVLRKGAIKHPANFLNFACEALEHCIAQIIQTVGKSYMAESFFQ